MIKKQDIKIYRPKNIDESNSQHLRAGYDIESKPPYSEKKLAEVSSLFHRRWMQFKGREI